MEKTTAHFGIRPAPVLILEDKAATLAYIENPPPLSGSDRFRVKSLWLCAELNEYERTVGYAYNVAAQRWIEAKHNLSAMPADGEPGERQMHTLIYNAQGYRRIDALIADGWQQGSQELLENRL